MSTYTPTRTKKDTDEVSLDSLLTPAEELGREFTRQWREAVLHRKHEKVGDDSLSKVLKDCYDAKDTGLTTDERAQIDDDDMWQNIPVSLVDFKCNLLTAMIREALIDAADAPFIVDPTPIPDVSQETTNRMAQEAKDEILQAAANLNMQGTPITAEQVLQIAREVKARQPAQLRREAAKQSKALERQLYDVTVEGNYKKALLEVTEDFALYPYCVMMGPIPTMSSKAKWENDQYTQVPTIKYEYSRVSPFDFFWSPDSTDTQTGTCVFVRRKMPLHYLSLCLQLANEEELSDLFDNPHNVTMSGYVKENLEKAMELGRDGIMPKDWSEWFDRSEEASTKFDIWRAGDVIDVITRYGRFQGSELQSMGYKGLNANYSYETVVLMVGGKIIQLYINDNPGPNPRPVFTASYQNRNGSIAGYGLAQKLLHIQRAYRGALRMMMANLGLSSEPVTEIDMARVAEYLPDDWDGRVYAGMTIPSDPDRLGNQGKAINFYNIPTNSSSVMAILGYLKSEAHEISNIPAALHGQPVGSGANRTVRGLLTLQGNALKPLQSAMANFDVGLVEPLAQLQYMQLVMFDEDFKYGGDSTIRARGAASMVQRELKRQGYMETLQLIGQLGDSVNPALVERILRLVIDEDILDPSEDLFAQAAPAPVAGAAPQAGGIPGTGPAPEAAGSPPGMADSAAALAL